MRTIKTLSLLIALLILTGMAAVAGVVADNETVSQAGPSTDNSTTAVPGDNSTPILPSPIPEPVFDNNTTRAPLTLALESHVYYPNDLVRAFVFNGTDPLVCVVDPAGAVRNLTVVKVNDSAFRAEYALDQGIILANYTVIAADNVTGEMVNDTFEVAARPVATTPLPNATITPDNGTAAQPYYLYLNLSQGDYTPNDKVGITISTNAGTPSATITDPAGNTAHVEMRGSHGDAYTGTYTLDKAVVLGNYTVTASVNAGGTYNYTTAHFNVTMEQDQETGLAVQYAAYDPVLKAIVVRANISAASSGPDVASAVENAPPMKSMNVKGVKVLSTNTIVNGSRAAGTKSDAKNVEVIIPVNSGNAGSVARQFNVTPDIARATTSVAVDASGTKIHLALNDKVDGCWYRLSAPVPAGYVVQSIARADGTLITNNARTDRITGEDVGDINWYVDKGTLYFYDDPINGYDVTLQPPMASASLAVNAIYGGQLSAIVYPFNQTDTNLVPNDHLGRDGDNGYARNIDPDAGSKTSVRLYYNNANTSTGNVRMFGNDGLTSSQYTYPIGYPTYYGGYTYTHNQPTYKYTNGSQQVVGFNTAPDGSVESVIITTFQSPQAGGVTSFVNITQKTIIRNNNLWFATVYYINNAGANSINGFRFYQGSDFNFNGDAQNDDDYYDAVNNTVYGFKDNADPNSIHVGGFGSPVASSAHDVDVYYQVWYDMQRDAPNGRTTTRGLYGYTSVDGGMALAWDHSSAFTKGDTWTVPILWAVSKDTNGFYNTITNAMRHNVYDVGIKSIDAPLNGNSVDKQTTSSLAINATAMDLGVTDQSTTAYLSIKNSAGTVVYTASTPVNLSIPFQETAPANFNWNLAGVTPGAYNISVYTQLSGDQNGTNDLKSVTVYVRDFTLYPGQWVHATPGQNVNFTVSLANLGAARTFDLSTSASSAGWATYLYNNSVSLSNMMATDSTGDGTWDWVNASFKDPATGYPFVNVTGTATLILQKQVPATADTNILDTVTLTAFPTGQPLVNASVVLRTDTPLASTANKTFYLHALTVNTTPDASVTPGKTNITAIFSMWAQVPAFADSFIVANSVSVPLYYSSAAAMPITVTLFYTNGAGTSVTIGSASSTIPASASQTVPSLYTFNISPAGGSVTIPKGYYLVAKVDNLQTTPFIVWYNNTYRSRIDVKTPTYVHVGAIATSNNTTQTSGFLPGDTVKVTANISDPIGAYDIAGATISVTTSNGSVLINNQSMALSLSDTGSPALWKLYNYSFKLNNTLDSAFYGINVTGYESNGVTARKNINISVISYNASISIIPNNTNTGVPGTAVDFKHTVSNLNTFQDDTVGLKSSNTRGWPVAFYRADGVTQLTDTNGDGLPDTGAIRPMGGTDIIARVSVPSTARAGDLDLITIIANSSLNKTLTVSATDTLSVPNANLSVAPNGTDATTPGNSVTYTHTITNRNAYLNDVAEVACTGNRSWPILLYKADGVTQLTDTDGDGRKDTGTLAPSGSADIVVKVSVPSGASLGDVDAITVTAASYQNASVTATASDTLVVFNADLDIYPDSTSLGSPNTAVSFDNTIDNLNLVGPDVADITYTSSLGWPVDLYQADGVTPLTDTDGDGKIDTGAIEANNSTDVIVAVTVPPYASAGDVDAVTVTARSSLNMSVSATVTDTIFIATSSVVKTLYLHDNNTQFMDTSPNNSANAITYIGPQSGKTPGTDTWYQSPPFARSFNILDDPQIYLYLRSVQNSNHNSHGNNNLNFTVTLISSNSSGSTTLGSVAVKWTNASGSATIYTVPASIHLTNRNVTIPAVNQLSIRIDNWDSDTLAVSQSTTYPARMNMNTQSYINVASVSFANATTYVPVSGVTPPYTIKVIANVTDPFGYFDIVNATVYATDSDGNTVINPIAMAPNGTDSRLWKKFETTIAMPSTFDTGIYNFVVNATETNSVTDSMSAQLPVVYPVNVTMAKSFAPTSNPDEYAVTITLANRDKAHGVNGVCAYDFASDDYLDGDFNVPWSYARVNNGLLNGTVNIYGPFNLGPGETKTITYYAQGFEGYKLSDMYIVGVDPRA